MQCKGAVPLEWLVSQTSTHVFVFFVVMAAAACAVGALLLVAGRGWDTGGLLAAATGVFLLVAALCRCTAKRSCRVFEGLTLLGFCIGASTTHALAYFQEDLPGRYFFAGAAMFVIKPLPVIIGMRPLAYVAFLVCSFVGEAVLYVRTQVEFGEEVRPGFFAASLVFMAAFVAVAWLANRWIGAVYQSNRQLAEVKEALEVLLFTFCDATFWLGADADTIVHCDRRFSLMLGQGAEGTRLSGHVVGTHEERARVGAAFRHLPTDAHGSPPAALHTTVCGGDGGLLSLELRIADRRGAGSQPGSYLVGVRIESGGVPGGHAPPLLHPALEAAAAVAGQPAAPAPERSVTSGSEGAPPLPELSEAVVEFDAFSLGLAVQSVALHFAAPAPQLAHCLPEAGAIGFMNWMQAQVNIALHGPEDLATGSGLQQPSDFGPVIIQVTQNLRLAGDSARLEVLDMPEDGNDESLTAKLRLGGPCQPTGGGNSGQRGPPLQLGPGKCAASVPSAVDTDARAAAARAAAAAQPVRAEPPHAALRLPWADANGQALDSLVRL